MSDALTGRAALLAVLLLPALCSAQSAPAEVSARPLSALSEPRALTAPAEVVARQDSALAAELALPIARVRVEVGDQVKAGDALVELDKRDVELQLRQARARLGAAQAQLQLAGQRLKRGRELAEKQFNSADDLLALEAAAAAAQAELEIADSDVAMARRSLDKATLRAPFDGEVVERRAQTGALAAPGSPLIRLVALGGQEVEARLPADQAEGLTRSEQLFFETQGARLPLKLLRLTRSVDPTARTRTARLAFVGNALQPGHSGQLSWQAPGFSVPAPMVVQRDGQLGVFRVEQGIARFVALPDAVAGRSAEVRLPGSTLVVSEGQQRLRDGDPVSLTAH